VNAETTPNPTQDSLPRRVRIVFRKGEAIQYISNLDLLRAWERTLRRARLPLAYSQGYNPHPRITIAMPLAVGCIGENEVVDVLLEAKAGPEEPDLDGTVRDALEPTMPPGLSLVSVTEVARPDPALATLFSHAVYQIVLADVDPAEVQARLTALLEKSKAPITFRRKTFDLRPLIGDLALAPASAAGPRSVSLTATLLQNERGRIGRPDALLQALDLEPYVRRVVRQQLVFDL
jgi:radical SAM-linked protein